MNWWMKTLIHRVGRSVITSGHACAVHASEVAWPLITWSPLVKHVALSTCRSRREPWAVSRPWPWLAEPPEPPISQVISPTDTHSLEQEFWRRKGTCRRTHRRLNRQNYQKLKDFLRLKYIVSPLACSIEPILPAATIATWRSVEMVYALRNGKDERIREDRFMGRRT